MPLYDYICRSCREEFDEIRSIKERRTTTCPKCGVEAILQVPKKAPGLSLFQPGWWRDIDYDPVYVGSPQELRNVCDRKNKRADCLENGIWDTSPGPDPTPESAPELHGGGGTNGSGD